MKNKQIKITLNPGRASTTDYKIVKLVNAITVSTTAVSYGVNEYKIGSYITTKAAEELNQNPNMEVTVIPLK